jgi:hypothetical protein
VILILKIIQFLLLCSRIRYITIQLWHATKIPLQAYHHSYKFSSVMGFSSEILNAISRSCHGKYYVPTFFYIYIFKMFTNVRLEHSSLSEAKLNRSSSTYLGKCSISAFDGWRWQKALSGIRGGSVRLCYTCVMKICSVYVTTGFLHLSHALLWAPLKLRAMWDAVDGSTLSSVLIFTTDFFIQNSWLPTHCK